jgi:hypothetical protein
VAKILLMNLCIIHKINNKFADEFFAPLCHHLFPEPNYLASNYYVARALTQKLILNYENIHACAKRCILFRKDRKDDVNCPKCGSIWYKDTLNRVLLVKMFCWFPIIPRLQWLFKTPTMPELMLWNSQNSNLDGLMKHPRDSKAWKHVHQKFPNFVTNPWNVHLTFVTNGVNPFKLTKSTWSTCLVMLLNYKLPHWLTSKKFFIMFTLLNLGKDYVWRTPNSLKDSNVSPKQKTVKEQGSGHAPWLVALWRGRGACWSFGMGLGRIDKLQLLTWTYTKPTQGG